jgi:CDP-diacylglycerol--glycerol-3-phosphate 3-phosphatidyltransferase
MRKLPNLLSILRMILSFSLLWCLDDRILFVALYLLCGLTDLLDGYIARKYDCQTRVGAILDSIADLCMFFIIVFALITWMGTVSSILWAGFLSIAGIRVINMLIALIRFRQFAILHTLANKASGVLLFLYPVEYLLFRSNVLLFLLFAVALFSAIEECILQMTCKTLDLNRKGLFGKQAESK